jgi:hypothetical protein
LRVATMSLKRLVQQEGKRVDYYVILDDPLSIADPYRY